MSRTVPLLITLDLEVAPDHEAAGQVRALERILGDYPPMTVFATADACAPFGDAIRCLADAGHEIGCHGLDHSSVDNYRTMTRSEARRRLESATATIGDASGKRPRCFRGPGMSTSAATQSVLVELGFTSDFSVCARRLDLFHSRGSSAGWLYAPHRPYRPATRSPYRRGDRPLLVVPLSGLGAPFLSGLLYLCGLRLMKALFRLLLAEARSRRTSIVYLFHSYEFSPYAPSREAGRRKPLHALYTSDRSRRYEMNLELIRYMASFDDVVPMRAGELVSYADSA